jgi:hypothetical protein
MPPSAGLAFAVNTVLFLVVVEPEDEECAEAKRLLNTYTALLHAFDKIQELILNDTAEPKAMVRQAEPARLVLLRARRWYWRHVKIHQCRSQEPHSTTTASAARRELRVRTGIVAGERGRIRNKVENR